MKIDILEPKGYCSGVTNAIFIAKKIKNENPEKDVFILGKLVHNDMVINNLSKLGITTLDNSKFSNVELISSLKEGSILIFTAHGHDEKLDELAKEKGLITYDSVCPKVKKNMNRIKEEILNGNDVIFIGKENHPETNACLSISNRVLLYNTNILKNNYITTNNKVYVTNQTTLNIHELKGIYDKILTAFPNAKIDNEICDSTRVRQEAISSLNDDVDLVLIVGDNCSSNTNRLLEISKQKNKQALSILIKNKDDITNNLIEGKKHIVIASGASTPDYVINEIYSYLKTIK